MEWFLYGSGGSCREVLTSGSPIACGMKTLKRPQIVILGLVSSHTNLSPASLLCGLPGISEVAAEVCGYTTRLTAFPI